MTHLEKEEAEPHYVISLEIWSLLVSRIWEAIWSGHTLWVLEKEVEEDQILQETENRSCLRHKEEEVDKSLIKDKKWMKLIWLRLLLLWIQQQKLLQNWQITKALSQIISSNMHLQKRRRKEHSQIKEMMADLQSQQCLLLNWHIRLFSLKLIGRHGEMNFLHYFNGKDGSEKKKKSVVNINGCLKKKNTEKKEKTWNANINEN